MAIIRNVVMRGASQRLGGVVFYTRSGETVARELAPAVSNPRTKVQMQQRVKLSNVVAMYKANKFWMPGAFEDKAEQETDYNAFVRFNLTNSRVALTKAAAAAGAGVVAPYKVSSGSINPIEQVGQQTGVRTNLYTGSLIITSATTVGNFAAALISNNNGIMSKMQLSLIVNIQRRNEDTQQPYIVARAYEVILDETSTKLLSDYIPLGILETLEETGRPLFFNGTTLGDGAATFILSNTISGRTSVSSQELVFYGNQSMYSIYTSAIAVSAAILSYGSNETRFLDSSEASEFNPVVLENYIQSIVYGATMYVAGQTVPTDLSASNNYFLYFSQPVGNPAGVNLVFIEDSETIECEVTAWNTDRTRATVQIPSGHTISAITDVMFEVNYGDITLEFEFTADPTTV